MDRDTRNTPLTCLVLSIGVLVAILAVFVYDHDKKLKALDSLSRKNEKLTEIIKGRYYFQYFHYWFGHSQIYIHMFHSFFLQDHYLFMDIINSDPFLTCKLNIKVHVNVKIYIYLCLHRTIIDIIECLNAMKFWAMPFKVTKNESFMRSFSIRRHHCYNQFQKRIYLVIFS